MDTRIPLSRGTGDVVLGLSCALHAPLRTRLVTWCPCASPASPTAGASLPLSDSGTPTQESHGLGIVRVCVTSVTVSASQVRAPTCHVWRSLNDSGADECPSHAVLGDCCLRVQGAVVGDVNLDEMLMLRLHDAPDGAALAVSLGSLEVVIVDEEKLEVRRAVAVSPCVSAIVSPPAVPVRTASTQGRFDCARATLDLLLTKNAQPAVVTKHRRSSRTSLVAASAWVSAFFAVLGNLDARACT